MIEESPEELEQLMLETVVEDRELGAEYNKWVKLIVGHSAGADRASS